MGYYTYSPLGVAFAAAILFAPSGKATDAISVPAESTGAATANGVSVMRDYEFSGSIRGGALSPAAIDDQGNLLVFSSTAADLVAGDTHSGEDVFVRNLSAGTNMLVSVSHTGGPANGRSSTPAISGNGRYIVFESEATNLVPDDTNGVQDIFLRDLQNGTTKLIQGPDPFVDAPHGRAEVPTISNDGRYITYQAENAQAYGSVYLHDQNTGTTIAVARATPLVEWRMDRQGNRIAVYERGINEGLFIYNISAAQVVQVNNLSTTLFGMSDDGDKTLFNTADIDDPNGIYPLYLYDASANTTTLVSPEVRTAAISGNGEVVVYEGLGFETFNHPLESQFDSKLVFFDVGANYGSVIYSEQLTTKSLLDVDFDLSSPGLLTVTNISLSISRDGSYAAFVSAQPGIVPQDSNDRPDIFLYDRVSNSIELISANSAGLPANGSSLQPFIAPDGESLFFESLASDLVMNDTNGTRDIFRHKIEVDSLRVGPAVVSPGTAKFVWRGRPGKTYQLQTATSLDSKWIDEGDPIVVEAAHSLDLATPLEGQRQFYRLKVVE